MHTVKHRLIQITFAVCGGDSQTTQTVYLLPISTAAEY